MVYTRKNKTNMKKYKNPLKNKKRSLRKKRHSLKKIKNKKIRQKRKTMRKKRQQGGNQPLINSATWVTTTPSFLPPGGGYVQGSDKNGLGGGYYYDVQTCPTPLPESTIGHPENLSSKQMKKQTGGAYTSLGGLTGLFRQGVHSIQNVISTYTTADRPVSPNPMKEQPIFKEFK